MVSTFGVILGVSTEQLQQALHMLFDARSAASFLTFCLLYTPCVAAVATIKRELGSRAKTVAGGDRPVRGRLAGGLPGISDRRVAGMSLADYALLAPIAGYFLWLLFRPRKKNAAAAVKAAAGANERIMSNERSCRPEPAAAFFRVRVAPSGMLYFAFPWAAMRMCFPASICGAMVCWK